LAFNVQNPKAGFLHEPEVLQRTYQALAAVAEAEAAVFAFPRIFHAISE